MLLKFILTLKNPPLQLLKCHVYIALDGAHNEKVRNPSGRAVKGVKFYHPAQIGTDRNLSKPLIGEFITMLY